MTRARAESKDLFRVFGAVLFLNDVCFGVLLTAALAVVAPLHALTATLTAVIAEIVSRRAVIPRELRDARVPAMNGFFAGLAVATFLGHLSLPLIALLSVSAAVMVVISATLLSRLLAPWSLPLSVAPYLLGFWAMWLAIGNTNWVQPPALAVSSVSSVSSLSDLPAAALRGIGMILFVPRVELGAALLVTMLLFSRRLAAGVAIAALGTTLIAHLAGLPAWQVHDGLAVFPAAIIASAVAARFPGVRMTHVGVAIVLSPFLEAACLRLAGQIGVHALSASYVSLFWGIMLVSAVRTTGPAVVQRSAQ